MFLEERTCNTATLLALKTAKATSNEAVFVHFLTFWILSHIRRLTIRVRCSLLRPLPVLRPLTGLKDSFPEPDGKRRDLHQLVVLDELKRLFQRQLPVRHEPEGLIGAGRKDALVSIRTPHR